MNQMAIISVVNQTVPPNVSSVSKEVVINNGNENKYLPNF